MPKEKVNWIALGGPWDSEVQRNTSIHLMFKEDWYPEKSLDESAEHSVIDKMIGDWTVLFIRPTTIDGVEAREIHTKCNSFNPNSFHHYDEMHPWVIFRHDRYTITIHYSASVKYFEAYTKAIESFTLLT